MYTYQHYIVFYQRPGQWMKKKKKTAQNTCEDHGRQGKKMLTVCLQPGLICIYTMYTGPLAYTHTHTHTHTRTCRHADLSFPQTCKPVSHLGNECSTVHVKHH